MYGDHERLHRSMVSSVTARARLVPALGRVGKVASGFPREVLVREVLMVGTIRGGRGV